MATDATIRAAAEEAKRPAQTGYVCETARAAAVTAAAAD